MYKNFSVIIVTIVFFICSGIAEIPADEFTIANEAEVLYGKGVHAFFDGNYKEAIAIFEKVEYLASEDPRPYFFAALARYRLDTNSEDADKYFKKAAILEWQGKSVREYDVSEALRRIQGKERLHIEHYRTQMKISWQKSNSTRDNIKYGEQKASDNKIVADVSKSFVGEAPFGANSPDPFKDGKDNKPKNSANLLDTILESGNVMGGKPTETVDVSVTSKSSNEYDKTAIEGAVQNEGEMIIEDEDVFAEFDDEPKQVADPKSTNESESPKEITPIPTPTPEPDAKTETTTETKTVDNPEPIVDPDSTNKPETTVEPKPADKPEPIVEPESTGKPEPTNTPESTTILFVL
ncbi:MAG: hypothetical protein LBC74_03210 [Planctomycetaceae bacterium]|jgi:hypothetical protein|nr:hypothetical protein [Planctomycetaceae bacterium]